MVNKAFTAAFFLDKIKVLRSSKDYFAINRECKGGRNVEKKFSKVRWDKA